jgi:hypothetical protein
MEIAYNGKVEKFLLGGIKGKLEDLARGAMFELFHCSAPISFAICQYCVAWVERLPIGGSEQS